MIRNKLSTIFSAAFLLIILVSCKPRKAIALRENIVQKERVAFKILVGKNGSNEQKLKYLISNDYKNAVTMVDKQEKEFDALIKEIETLPAEGIQQGNELKTAAANYYVAVKELTVFDRIEITHQEAYSHMQGKELDTALHKNLELSIQKQELYKKVYEKEKAFSEALENFNTVNNLK
ncbi:hypothetical protein [Chitinophaga sp. 22620]|uniref:hypothetical protein n=1 Tax=Chitinophaga sp. 22620 TaxID=3453952 RepID=UPI003F87A21B